MSSSRHCWATAVLGLILALGVVVSCGGKGNKQSEKPRLDPMYAVSDGARFTSNGEQRGYWQWLTEADQTAHWDFSGLPDDLTDLVTQLRVAVPDDADEAEFYLVLGTTGSGGADRRLGVTKATIPAREPVAGEPRLALASITIPKAAIPEGTTSVWLEASREDPTGDHPTLAEEVAFQKGSVRFSPLRLAASDEPPVPDETTTTGPVVEGPSDGAARTPAPSTTTQPPATTQPSQSGTTFVSDGDLISGWWWLRDSAGTDQGEWTLPVPKTGSIRLDLEVLATSGVNGPPGVRARFWLSWGPVVGGATGTGGRTRHVVLQNTSPSGDPVGYTNTGSLTLAAVPNGAKRFWVRIRRVDEQGQRLDADHVAVQETSVRLHGSGGTTTTTTGTTTSTTTTTGTTTSTTTTTGSTTNTTSTIEPPDTTVASCDESALSAATFAPVQSAARWYSTQDGQRFMLLRTNGDTVSLSMPEDYTHPINQHGTWTFRKLPAGSGDVKVRFNARFRVNTLGSPSSEERLYVTYGPMPGSGAGRVQGTETVTLTKLNTPAIQLPTGALPNQAIQTRHWQDYYWYRGEVTLPRSQVSGAAGFWVRASLYDLSTDDYWGATAALNQSSAEVCTGNRPPVARPDQPSTPQVAVTLDSATRGLTTDSSFLVDPGTDLDGDGLNQTFEDAAAGLVNPVFVFDEEEDSVAFRSRLTMAARVHVRPWTTYRDVQYVLFEYLPTFALDGGVGITFSDFNDDWVRIGVEAHRGDSEKVYLAYRVVDNQHLVLDEVFTSAHDDGTMHNGHWAPSGTTCNIGNVTVLDVGAVSKTVESEQMCGSLQFDGSGRLLVYPSRNKHAMYPSKATGEAVTLVKLRVTPTIWTPYSWYALGVTLAGGTVEVPFTETCGYDPILARTYDDTRYLGDGRWRLDVFNVGEPGNWLINSLWSPTGWRGLTDAQIAKLTNRFPNENVWTARVQGTKTTEFCGGLDTTMGDYTYPEACSGRLGAKYDQPPQALLAALGD